jgi:hypothetical protein
MNSYNGALLFGGGWNTANQWPVHINNIVQSTTEATAPSTNFVRVIGANLGDDRDRIRYGGYITPYDINGVPTQNVAGYWHMATIHINNNTRYWAQGGVSLAVQRNRVQATFIHEVGHIFKLAHPGSACQTRAIMQNGGFPANTGKFPWNATSHDRACILRKWG